MLTMLAQEDREHVLRGMQAIIDSYAVKTVGKASGYQDVLRLPVSLYNFSYIKERQLGLHFPPF